MSSSVELSNLETSKFYDILAGEYDEMTSFDARLERETKVFEKLIKEKSINKALDAGCGSGFLSILLSKLGVDVTGVDASEAMIEKAVSNSKRFDLNIKFIHSDFINLKKIFDGEFDCVFCLGNTLVHMTGEKELLLALRSFYNVLKPGGTIVVQILNYDKILSKKERIINVKETESKIFVRFYDHDAFLLGSDKLKTFEIKTDILRFNVLIVNRKDFSYKLISTQIRAIKSDELVKKVNLVGFKNVEIFSDLEKSRFSSDESKNLVLFANKF